MRKDKYMGKYNHDNYYVKLTAEIYKLMSSQVM
jgi:hypothetical protein